MEKVSLREGIHGVLLRYDILPEDAHSHAPHIAQAIAARVTEPATEASVLRELRELQQKQ